MSAGSNVIPIRLNQLVVNLLVLPVIMLLCSAGIAVARVLPHHTAFQISHAPALLISIIALIIVHEGLHGLGLRLFAGVAWRDIKFGFMGYLLTPYCHCRVPICIRDYRRMALLPLWGTGAITVLAMLIHPTDWLGFLAGFSIAACVGDVWIVVKLKDLSSHLHVQDCASDIGCDVFTPAD